MAALAVTNSFTAGTAIVAAQMNTNFTDVVDWATGSPNLSTGGSTTTVNGKLTVTEFLLLESLASRPGYVKSRDQLMSAAYDDDIYVDDRTIDSHIKRLRKKFKSYDPAFDQIRTRYGSGYSWRE